MGPTLTMGGGGWEILHRGDTHALVVDAQETGLDGVFVGGKRDSIYSALLQKADGNRNSTFEAMAFHGHARWAPGRMDGEVHRGAWSLHNITGDIIFNTHAK